MTSFASWVVFAQDLDRTTAFYRAIGVDLEDEQHEDGTVHHVCELGPVHVAVYAAETPGWAPARRAGGTTFPGFWVDSLESTEAALVALPAD